MLLHLLAPHQPPMPLTCVLVKPDPGFRKLSFRLSGRIQISIIFHPDSAHHSRLLSYFWTLILSSGALAVPVLGHLKL